jgi:hypothetical protein
MITGFLSPADQIWGQIQDVMISYDQDSDLYNITVNLRSGRAHQGNIWAGSWNMIGQSIP